MTRNVYTTREPFINSFLQDPRPEMKYRAGRMYTRESPEGDGIELVAYGNEIVARHDGDELTFFVGHHGQVSRTVTGYVKLFGSVLSNGGFNFEVDIRREAPTNGYIARHINSAAAQFISNYVDYRRELSAVEQDAVESVENALQQILEIEWGDE